MDLSSIDIEFEYGKGDNATEREIIRNVQTILTTPVGSCPLYRDFGIDVTTVDKPMDVAQNLYAVAIMEAVEKYEPRVRVQEVTFSPDDSGQLKAKVVIAHERTPEIGL